MMKKGRCFICLDTGHIEQNHEELSTLSRNGTGDITLLFVTILIERMLVTNNSLVLLRVRFPQLTQMIMLRTVVVNVQHKERRN